MCSLHPAWAYIVLVDYIQTVTRSEVIWVNSASGSLAASVHAVVANSTQQSISLMSSSAKMGSTSAWFGTSKRTI